MPGSADAQGDINWQLGIVGTFSWRPGTHESRRIQKEKEHVGMGIDSIACMAGRGGAAGLSKLTQFGFPRFAVLVLVAVLLLLGFSMSASAQTAADDCAVFELLYTQTDGRITQANLYNQGLTGVLPPTIANVVQLQVLDLGANSLQGTLTAALAGLVFMKTLHLDSNLFSGTIPDLTSMQRLTELFLSGNTLTGQIDNILPPSVTTCTLTDANTNVGLFSCTSAFPAACVHAGAVINFGVQGTQCPITGTSPRTSSANAVIATPSAAPVTPTTVRSVVPTAAVPTSPVAIAPSTTTTIAVVPTSAAGTSATSATGTSTAQAGVSNVAAGPPTGTSGGAVAAAVIFSILGAVGLVLGGFVVYRRRQGDDWEDVWARLPLANQMRVRLRGDGDGDRDGPPYPQFYTSKPSYNSISGSALDYNKPTAVLPPPTSSFRRPAASDVPPLPSPGAMSRAGWPVGSYSLMDIASPVDGRGAAKFAARVQAAKERGGSDTKTWESGRWTASGVVGRTMEGDVTPSNAGSRMMQQASRQMGASGSYNDTDDHQQVLNPFADSQQDPFADPDGFQDPVVMRKVPKPRGSSMAPETGFGGINGGKGGLVTRRPSLGDLTVPLPPDLDSIDLGRAPVTLPRADDRAPPRSGSGSQRRRSGSGGRSNSVKRSTSTGSNGTKRESPAGVDREKGTAKRDGSLKRSRSKNGRSKSGENSATPTRPSKDDIGQYGGRGRQSERQPFESTASLQSAEDPFSPPFGASPRHLALPSPVIPHGSITPEFLATSRPNDGGREARRVEREARERERERRRLEREAQLRGVLSPGVFEPLPTPQLLGTAEVDRSLSDALGLESDSGLRGRPEERDKYEEAERRSPEIRKNFDVPEVMNEEPEEMDLQFPDRPTSRMSRSGRERSASRGRERERIQEAQNATLSRRKSVIVIEVPAERVGTTSRVENQKSVLADDRVERRKSTAKEEPNIGRRKVLEPTDFESSAERRKSVVLAERAALEEERVREQREWLERRKSVIDLPVSEEREEDFPMENSEFPWESEPERTGAARASERQMDNRISIDESKNRVPASAANAAVTVNSLEEGSRLETLEQSPKKATEPADNRKSIIDLATRVDASAAERRKSMLERPDQERRKSLVEPADSRIEARKSAVITVQFPAGLRDEETERPLTRTERRKSRLMMQNEIAETGPEGENTESANVEARTPPRSAPDRPVSRLLVKSPERPMSRSDERSNTPSRMQDRADRVDRPGSRTQKRLSMMKETGAASLEVADYRGDTFSDVLSPYERSAMGDSALLGSVSGDPYGGVLDGMDEEAEEFQGDGPDVRLSYNGVRPSFRNDGRALSPRGDLDSPAPSGADLASPGPGGIVAKGVRAWEYSGYVDGNV
ncbi:hypothetical protein HDU93_009067 [Gonapodya sp. JEL0774]|nr:hypothetical protein HDU93_009067 [Gonapodya sp. JEL0774]